MRCLPAIASALALLLGATRADAFCRSSACPPRADGATDGHLCTPAQPDDCGIPLQWRQPCIGFNIEARASNQVDYTTAETTLTRAFAAWTAVDCKPGTPSIQVFDLGPVTCATVEYNQHAGNTNVLLFRDDVWPHQTDNGLGTTDTIALTTVTYDVDKGDIYDADIEVNSANNRFTTTDTPGPNDVDLLSVLTHEAGHFLGVAHSPTQGTTMFPNYDQGTISIRNLAQDDDDAICAAYPPYRVATGDCTGIPRHGYAPECAVDQTYVRCAMGTGGGGAGAAVLLSIAAVMSAARARRGSRRSS